MPIILDTGKTSRPRIRVENVTPTYYVYVLTGNVNAWTGHELMIEEILPKLYKVEIPLPDNPLRAVNSYVVKGSDRTLIIDTGWNKQECMDTMGASLRKLGIDLRKTDFFITHFHADHLALVSRLATDASKVYFNQPDADLIRNTARWGGVMDFARASGFPERELQTILRSHPGYRYASTVYPAFTILEELDTLSIGKYEFQCVETPGHTRGHMCLYEANKRILVAGDHILDDITPNIQLWSNDRNPLKEYLASLEKINGYDIELTLPGHRRVVENYRKRIQELRKHHQERAEEVLSILQTGVKTAYQVASQMSWDIIYDTWELFPYWQKWFAMGEATAHLKYLEENGMVRREDRNQKIEFSAREKHS